MRPILGLILCTDTGIAYTDYGPTLGVLKSVQVAGFVLRPRHMSTCLGIVVLPVYLLVWSPTLVTMRPPPVELLAIL